MRQIPNFADARQLTWCVYCGGSLKGTRDHVPSKVLLDEPFPEHLPVVEACRTCNSSFSLDEEYVACLVECTLAGSADPDGVGREKVRRILLNRPGLRARLSAARMENDDGTFFRAEIDRINNVVLKLARGHAAFELNEPQFEPPTSVAAAPLPSLPATAHRAFETPPAPSVWPEVGSRAEQRLLERYDVDAFGWIVVQEGRYRFLASTGGAVIVRIVLSEYLACEVVWSAA